MLLCLPFFVELSRVVYYVSANQYAELVFLFYMLPIITAYSFIFDLAIARDLMFKYELHCFCTVIYPFG